MDERQIAEEHQKMDFRISAYFDLRRLYHVKTSCAVNVKYFDAPVQFLVTSI